MRYDKDMTKGYYWILELKNGRIVNESRATREESTHFKAVFWAKGGLVSGQVNISGHRFLSIGDDIVLIIDEEALKELDYDTNL